MFGDFCPLLCLWESGRCVCLYDRDINFLFVRLFGMLFFALFGLPEEASLLVIPLPAKNVLRRVRKSEEKESRIQYIGSSRSTLYRWKDLGGKWANVQATQQKQARKTRFWQR